MVRKGINLDSFDSIRVERIWNTQALIGATSDEQTDNELELYDKSLVLTEKWDKLPVLEKINFTPTFNRTLAIRMNASGVNMIRFRIEVYNCEQDDIDDDHLIDAYQVVAYQNGGIMIGLESEHEERDFNIPLRNRITFRSTLESDVSIAVANLAAETLGGILFLNIDWVKYTTEQLKDWILKEVFIDD